MHELSWYVINAGKEPNLATNLGHLVEFCCQRRENMSAFIIFASFLNQISLTVQRPHCGVL